MPPPRNSANCLLTASGEAGCDWNAESRHNLDNAGAQGGKGNAPVRLYFLYVWFMFLRRNMQVPELHSLWVYCEKQKSKCTSLAALQHSAENRDSKVLLEKPDEKEVQPRLKWAIKFDSGEMHRYTTAQIQDKFGVDEVQAGMELNHKTRGHAIVVMSFAEQRGSIETNEVATLSISICLRLMVSQS